VFDFIRDVLNDPVDRSESRGLRADRKHFNNKYNYIIVKKCTMKLQINQVFVGSRSK